MDLIIPKGSHIFWCIIGCVALIFLYTGCTFLSQLYKMPDKEGIVKNGSSILQAQVIILLLAMLYSALITMKPG